jgi:predicted kinase
MKPKPSMVLITGIAGIGKTTLCNQILRDWKPGESGKILHMDKDVFMKDFYSRVEPDTPYHTIIQDETKENHFLYSVFYRLIEYELSRGRTVLVDNPHIKEFLWNPEWRKLMNSITEKTGSRLIFVKCSMPSLEEYKERLRERGFRRDVKKLKDEEGFRKFQEHEPMDFTPPQGSLEVDVSKQPEESSRLVIEHAMKTQGITL